MIAVSPSQPKALSKARLEMIESAGRLCQLLGLPRSTGQIYGLLFLSPEPLSLDHMVEMLGISKASASTGTRQLCSFKAVRQVWIHGKRRDHFEVVPDMAALLRTGYAEFLKPRLTSSKKRLDQITASLEEDAAGGVISEADHKLCKERLENFSAIHARLQSLLPLAENLF